MSDDGNASPCYLFFTSTQNPSESVDAENAFHEAADEEAASILCVLFNQRHGGDSGGRAFRYIPATALQVHEQIFFSESVGWASVYSDPDPTVYDPPPSRSLVERGRYSLQAVEWESLVLQQRSKRPNQRVAGDSPSLLAELLRAVEKHRLTFLYFARPVRRNPTSQAFWERLDDRHLPDGKIPSDDIEGTGEFLFRHRNVLDRFAQAAVSRFGSGKGRKPSRPDVDGKPIEIEGGSYPVWDLDADDCVYLDESASAVLAASTQLVRFDSKLSEVARQARFAAYDEGCQRWYADSRVRWEYLERLDACIQAMKNAEFERATERAEEVLIAFDRSKTSASPATTDQSKVDQMSEEKCDPRNVFVVYGRNDDAKRAMFEFLRALKLNPLEWDEMVKECGEGTPHPTDVIEKGFAIAQAVIVLLTPDDEARLRTEYCGPHEEEHETRLTPQPRPNVLFEAGMAFGINRRRTIIVEIGRTRPISDLAGRHTVRFDGTVSKRNSLVTRLQTAGCHASKDSEDWLEAGDFDKVLSAINLRNDVSA